MADTFAVTVEIKTKQLIKTSSPTPPHLKNLRLSLIDQLAPDCYIPLILFYPSNGNIHQRLQSLRSSLSQVLTHFYPLAGRIKDNIFVDCDDQGVWYFEGQVKCSIYEILKQPDLEVLRKLLPIDSKAPRVGRDCFLIVQVSFFQCGGLAIGVCFSHRINDASTFASFIKSWAAISRGGTRLVSSEFNTASMFPPLEPMFEVPPMEFGRYKCATRRCVFNGEKLAELKAKAAGDSVKQPSRVEAVTALIWKCAMTASKSKNGFRRPSALAQLVNLRKKFVPPLSENCMGNIVGSFLVETGNDEMELPTLVSQLRRKLEEYSEKCADKLGGNEASSFLLGYKSDGLDMGRRLDYYICTSWCRFPLYEADFGWGKPNWVTYVPPLLTNMILLMDTKEGDGIEAWVTLSEDDMVFFEDDHDLLAFTSLDPATLC